MAVTLANEVVLPAPRELVWEKLNDPEVLARAIPGCQSLEQNADGGFEATVRLSIGPIKATFKGAVDLCDLDPPNSYRIVGKGEGGVAGFATGEARVALADHPEGTLLTYTVEANIGGKIAQLGNRLIGSVAGKLAGQFFARFADEFKAAES